MKLPEDIETRIKNDFPDASEKELIEGIVSSLPEKERDRVTRCLLFIANGNLTLFEEWSHSDYRDVIMAGEYEHLTNKKIRDFNEPFST